MGVLETIVLVIHIITCLILIAVVLLQSGKSAGLSGSIAGGAETFFGKNKGRTMDKKLATLTKVFAIVFLVTSITFSYLLIKEDNSQPADDGAGVESVDDNAAGAQTEAPSGDAAADTDAPDEADAPAEDQAAE